MLLPIIDSSQPHAQVGNGPAHISSVRVLRISVTDRCNYRCVYCMPEAGVPWLPKSEILNFDEIAQVAKAAIRVHGIRRFKLTGGEPTVRNGLVDLVSTLRCLDGIVDLSLTTNGQRLAELAQPLRRAGLDSAEAVGLNPIKINCVTMRGINDTELSDFARLTLDRKVTVRFIEFMPLGESVIGPAAGCDNQNRGENALIPEAEARTIIENEFGPLLPVERRTEAGVGPATVWRIPNARGRIGFISAMSSPFCSTCNRLRLTADGLLRSCLFDGGEVDVKPILRGPDPSSKALAHAMSECVRLKPKTHSYHGNKQMSMIGG